MGNTAPTAQLEALATQRGERAVFQPVDIPRRKLVIPMSYVSVTVGDQQFLGEGRTPKEAKDAAAAEALKALLGPENVPGEHGPKITRGFAIADDEKSAVTRVIEMARKRNQWINFVVSENNGRYITKCTVGKSTTEGEGVNPKVSKKIAAENMIKKLRMLKEPTKNNMKGQGKVTKAFTTQRKGNSINVAHSQFGKAMDPLSCLYEIQQAKNERGPVFTVVDERGEPPQVEVVMQCTVGKKSAEGSGPNQSVARIDAAEAMLKQMGYSRKTAKAAQHSGQPKGTKKLPPDAGKTGKTPAPALPSGSNANGQKEPHWSAPGPSSRQ